MKILIEEKLKNIAFKCTQSIGSVWSLIIHTTLFVISFLLYFLGFELNSILLILTTIVSLEAIYLSIFIQMSVNMQSQKLHDVAEDVEEMQEDIEEINEDIEEINEDEDEDDDDSDLIEIKETMSKLMSEFGNIKKQIKKIQDGVEEINEDDEDDDDTDMTEIKETMNKLMTEVKSLKNQLKNKK